MCWFQCCVIYASLPPCFQLHKKNSKEDDLEDHDYLNMMPILFTGDELTSRNDGLEPFIRKTSDNVPLSSHIFGPKSKVASAQQRSGNADLGFGVHPNFFNKFLEDIATTFDEFDELHAVA